MVCDRQTDNATYRSAIADKKNVKNQKLVHIIFLVLLLLLLLFRWVHPSLYEGVSVRLSVGLFDGLLDGLSITCFLTPRMDNFLHENHRGSPTLTLLKVLNA